MLVKEIRNVEYKYYGCHDDMVVPQLLCYYFEEGSYTLVYYLANEHQREFAEGVFYLMMARMMLGYEKEALEIYKKNKGEWYHFCKQYGIYWKHVALFGLLFRETEISPYYQQVFDEHYDHECVEVLLLSLEIPGMKLERLEQYQKLKKDYPILEKIGKPAEESEQYTVATFERMQWKIWKRYNARIGNGTVYGMEEIYAKKGIRIYSYKPKEVSASMHIITDETKAIILDCGCELHDLQRMLIPVNKILQRLTIPPVMGVFISHAHMDHYGSINEVKGLPLYMTEETRELIRYVSPELYLGKVQILSLGEQIQIGGVQIRYVPNGHIRGSAMLDIQWKEDLRIVYTGDYSLEDQETVKGFSVEELMKNPKRVDVLITESTYGNKPGMLKLKEYEAIVKMLCEKFTRYGNKIIIPSFAVGRCQEVALLLADTAKKQGLKILIDGMAAAITGYYQMSLGQNIISKNISVCHHDREYREKIAENDIILASSGMIREGSTSAKYIEQMIEETNTCVMKVGFIHEEEYLFKSILNRKNANLRLVDVPLSAHAGYQALVQVTQKISPDCAIYVHGRGIFPDE